MSGASTSARARADRAWEGVSWRRLLRQPLPHLAGAPLTRWIARGLLAAFRAHVIGVSGLEHVRPENDPFIIVLNHSQKYEVMIVPTLMIFHRGGKKIHFLADWNYQLVPGVWLIYECGGVIRLPHKPAKPDWLNVFKPLLTDREPAFQRAARVLADGAPVGVFPEGTVNRDPRRLLPGRLGAARLSIESRVPVVPAGIRFPEHGDGRPIPDGARMEVKIGAPLAPPEPDRDGRAPRGQVLAWHAAIMRRLAELSGKAWRERGDVKAGREPF